MWENLFLEEQFVKGIKIAYNKGEYIDRLNPKESLGDLLGGLTGKDINDLKIL